MTVQLLARARREIDTKKASEPHKPASAERCDGAAVLRWFGEVRDLLTRGERTLRRKLEALPQRGDRVASWLGAGARQPSRDNDVRRRHIDERRSGSSQRDKT
jgi:hypothetical protein